ENEKIRAENRALREARQRAEETSRRERMAALASAGPGGSRDAANDSLDWGPSMAIEARPYDEPRSEGSAGERSEEIVPTFAVIASYEMKSVRQRGAFQVDLNKYTTDRVILRFDENVGDLRSQMNEGNFRQVNLDDPLYKQRELAVFVDGMNAKDFGDYINFATVQLRKKHEGGQE